MDLAEQDNTQAENARIGVLNRDGQIVPATPPAQNLIYGRKGNLAALRMGERSLAGFVG